MRYAVVARSPVFGGRLAAYDPAPARAVAGVRAVVALDNAVAVVGDTTWAAMQGRAALRISWEAGPNAELSSAAVQDELRQRLPRARNQSARLLEAVYEVPYYAHATMEPMNCVADVRPDRCEIWAPTQAPQRAASRITGLPQDAVAVHVTLMGMGLGRRSATDFVAEAVQVSQAIGGPAQVLWTRENDMQHDFYHPTSLHYLRASVEPAAEIQVQTASVGRGGGAGTYVAQVVEVSVEGAGRVRVRRVVCAVDCGIAINPAMIAAQIEGGIVHAITTTLKSAITVAERRVQQGNFDSYPLLRLDEMPAVEVHIVASARPPQGMGEMGVRYSSSQATPTPPRESSGAASWPRRHCSTVLA
jgi:CO/xanthine dehydrogenase Mo-binding subunit